MSEPAKIEASTPPWWVCVLVGRRPWRTLARVLCLIGLSAFLFKVVLIPIRVQGTSMTPAYQDGSINFINRWAYRWSPIKRGDVVGIQLLGPNGLILKRVIGLPGERLAIKHGVVHINGQPLTEPYVHRASRKWELTECKLGPEEYYVVGDNRGMPLADHFHRAIKRSDIAGKVLF